MLTAKEKARVLNNILFFLNSSEISGNDQIITAAEAISAVVGWRNECEAQAAAEEASQLAVQEAEKALDPSCPIPMKRARRNKR